MTYQAGISNIRIFPSLISAHLLRLEDEIKSLEPYCDGFHIDIMDGKFAPNLTLGPSFVNAIARITKKQLWVHLMVDNPQSIIEMINPIQNSLILSFHIESTNSPEKIIDFIKKKKFIPSIAIRPKTSLQEIFPLLGNMSHALLMSVEPGFSGQEFIKSSTDRLIELNDYKMSNNLSFTIGLDGGINKTNICELYANGATDFAVASAIFSSDNPQQALKELYTHCIKRS